MWQTNRSDVGEGHENECKENARESSPTEAAGLFLCQSSQNLNVQRCGSTEATQADPAPINMDATSEVKEVWMPGIWPVGFISALT